MKSVHVEDTASVNAARTAFLHRQNIDPALTTLVRLTYDTDNYRRYVSLDDSQRGDGIIRPSRITSDALIVTAANHALFLPLADCIGAVIHDASRGILMLSHLGRHNLEQHGGEASIRHLVETYGCDPTHLAVWLSPAAGGTEYPLYAFDHRGLHEVAIEQLQRAGIRLSNITASPVNSASDTQYYSHSQFLSGNRLTDGRFAVVAMLS